MADRGRGFVLLMIVHTFNSPDAFIRHNHHAASNDVLLLIEDGVFCLANPLFAAPPGLLALQDDLDQRGIQPLHTVEPITYGQWVNLVAQALHTLTWS